jgi:hypothetical protein
MEAEMRCSAIFQRPLVTAVGVLVAAAATASAQTLTTTSNTNNNNNNAQVGSAHIIEWDLPMPVDFNPGAVVVDTRGEDNNRAWFVTRAAETTTKVYRFDFGPSLMKNNGNARWTSWDLTRDVINNGGIAKLRPSHDRRFLVVRTSSSIQEVDTQACPAGTISNPTNCPSGLRRWDFTDPESPDPDSVFVSDLAVDDGRRIFTVGRSQAFPEGYLQMLIPTKVPFTSTTDPIKSPAGTVTRWHVDGVDQCQSFGVSGFCNSGIDLQPDNQNQNLIYVSNQALESIDEVNIVTNQIRRWVLPPDTTGQPVAQPRQLKIDSNGIIWAVTGSGHLVSLNPKNSSRCPRGWNLVTRHRMPPEIMQNDGWGVAPDSHVVGYTDANNNKVGMLVPHDSGTCVQPVSQYTTKSDIPATVTTVPTNVMSDVTAGIPKNVLKKTTKKEDGTYVEAVINMPAPNADMGMAPPDSMSPLGLTPVKWKGESTFFYAVGMSAGADPTLQPSMAKRVGFVRLGVPDREKFDKPRDDDDADDGMDRTTHPTWHVSAVGDDDADGVPDEYDTPNSRENMSAYVPEQVAPMTPSSGYAVSTTTTTLALLATAQGDSLTSTIAVDVYNSLGTLVTTSGPLLGVATVTLPSPGAGNFTVKVRNLGATPANVTPTVVTRELLP